MIQKGRIVKIEYHARFLKSFSKLPKKIVNKAEIKEKIFKQDQFNPILRTHKLHGEEKESWGFWIDYTYRIKFIFLTERLVLFLDVGTHDIYK